MESTDEMDFYERMKSLIGQFLTVFIWKRTYADQETAIFRRIVQNFPHIIDIAQHCPLVMVNSNELYELPRPTLAKIVNIGGIGMQLNDTRPLPPMYRSNDVPLESSKLPIPPNSLSILFLFENISLESFVCYGDKIGFEEFHEIVDKCEGLVIVSFGSIAPSHLMPETWKKAFLEAFTSFRNLHFVFRYEGSDMNDRLPPNVHLFKWIPQADLLRHPKTIAFISHGGYNSLQEVISAGVPLITIALWGDQPRNAKLAAKLGIAVNLQKSDISTITITDALNKVINDRSYSRNVKRLSLMVKKQPVSPAHRLVAWAEFVAEFKTLDNLVPAGTKLNFVQYHSLDVIAYLSAIVILMVFILWNLLKFMCLRILFLVARVRKLKQS